MLEYDKSYIDKHYELAYLEFLLIQVFLLFGEAYCKELMEPGNMQFIIDFCDRGGIILYMEGWYLQGSRILEYMRDIYGLEEKRFEYKSKGSRTGIYYIRLTHEEVESIFLLSYMKIGDSGIEERFIEVMRDRAGGVLADSLSGVVPSGEVRIGIGSMNKTMVYVKDFIYLDRLNKVLYKYLPERCYEIAELKKAVVWKYRCMISLKDKEYIGIVHIMSVDRWFDLN